MRKLLFIALLVFSYTLGAVPVRQKPVVRIQPNGDTLHLFVTGDEYYHRLHDAENYTIIQHPQTGYWVYADKEFISSDRWNVVATDYVVGKVNPRNTALAPNISVDRISWQKLQHKYDFPGRYSAHETKTSGRNHGTLNNIVIFIRFADDDPIYTPFSTIDSMFNASSDNAISMYNYYKSVTYNKLNIVTHFNPAPDGDNVICYQDSLPRCRFMPYNSRRNPEGYRSYEYAEVEMSLLERAINYVNEYSPIPESLNIDMDSNGKVDNVCFIIKGEVGDWNDMLWPHMWNLLTRNVSINGKLVDNYNFLLEGSGPSYFNVSTFCHEMFHTLGAPDLYHYEINYIVNPVGEWDIMASNGMPPQNMSAYMKWKYGNWLDSIPEIRQSGTYSLHSVGSNNPDNCCYKVATPHPNQWYLLEYRNYNDQFDQSIPGSGLIIYRVDDRYNGNQSYDGRTSFDEVYVFRPGGINATTEGTVAQAFFSGATNRTRFDSTTDPHPWLTGNVRDTSISVSEVSVPEETITFRVDFASSGDAAISIVVDEPQVMVSHRTITVNDAACRQVSLYDITGRRILTSKGSEQTLLTAPSSGVYLLQIEGLPAKKVVVM